MRNSLRYTCTYSLRVYIRASLMQVEWPLIEGKLGEIDEHLLRAEGELKWSSEGLWEYIEATREQVRDLEKRTQKCRDNVEEVERLMSTWKNSPLVTRKDGKQTEPLPHRDEYRAVAQRRSVNWAGRHSSPIMMQGHLMFVSFQLQRDRAGRCPHSRSHERKLGAA